MDNNSGQGKSPYITSLGYVRIRSPNHPRASKGSVYQHVLVAEAALKKFLPDGAVVHHIDGNRANNRNDNLLVCNQGYHRLLHQRMDALAACGHAGWRKCYHCGLYSDPQRMVPRGDASGATPTYYHRECENEYNRKRHALKKQGTKQVAKKYRIVKKTNNKITPCYPSTIADFAQYLCHYFATWGVFPP